MLSAKQAYQKDRLSKASGVHEQEGEGEGEEETQVEDAKDDEEEVPESQAEEEHLEEEEDDLTSTPSKVSLLHACILFHFSASLLSSETISCSFSHSIPLSLFL